MPLRHKIVIASVLTIAPALALGVVALALGRDPWFVVALGAGAGLYTAMLGINPP